MISALSMGGMAAASPATGLAEGVALADVADDDDERPKGIGPAVGKAATAAGAVIGAETAVGRAVPVWPIVRPGIANHSARLKANATARRRLTVIVIAIATISVRVVFQSNPGKPPY